MPQSQPPARVEAGVGEKLFGGGPVGRRPCPPSQRGGRAAVRDTELPAGRPGGTRSLGGGEGKVASGERNSPDR